MHLIQHSDESLGLSFFLLNMKHFDKWLKRLNFGGTEDLSISHMYEHIHTHTQTHQNMLIIMLGRVVGIECDRRLQTKVGWTQVKENVGEREREREREKERPTKTTTLSATHKLVVRTQWCN